MLATKLSQLLIGIYQMLLISGIRCDWLRVSVDPSVKCRTALDSYRMSAPQFPQSEEDLIPGWRSISRMFEPNAAVSLMLNGNTAQ